MPECAFVEDRSVCVGREAALVMCEYVDHPSTELAFDPPFFEKREADASPVLVELGSGTGIVAARIANSTSFPDDGIIVATDLPDVCPLLAHNLRKPGSTSSLFTSKMLVRPLAWGNIDHVIAIAQELVLSRGTRPICGLRTPHTRRLTHIVCSDLVGIYSRIHAIESQTSFPAGVLSRALRSSPAHADPPYLADPVPTDLGE